MSCDAAWKSYSLINVLKPATPNNYQPNAQLASPSSRTGVVLTACARRLIRAFGHLLVLSLDMAQIVSARLRCGLIRIKALLESLSDGKWKSSKYQLMRR